MAPKKRTMRDALCALDSDSSDDSEQEPGDKEDDTSGPNDEAKAQEQKRIRLEALERAGYSSGPSLLHIPKQPDDDVGVPSGWSTGKGESITQRPPTAEASQVQERAEMREITAFGVAEEAAYAKKAIEHATKLREEHKKEKAEKAQKKKLTFKEKEKRKRDTGKQASDKNYVEEEKRIAREHGCYHGFDS